MRQGLLANEVDSWMIGINRNVEGKQTRKIMRYSGALRRTTRTWTPPVRCRRSFREVLGMLPEFMTTSGITGSRHATSHNYPSLL